MHLLRAGTTWLSEVRLDGVESRKAALDALRARAKTTPRGEWIYTLGGWAMEQFADDKTPFTRAELDRVAPDHPVFLQASYYRGYLNSRAVQALGVDAPTGVWTNRASRACAARMPARRGNGSRRAPGRCCATSPDGADLDRQRGLRRGRAAGLPAMGGASN